MNATTARIQNDTRTNAANAGERWTHDDLTFVVAFTDDATDADLALSLGRSLFALWSIQHRLRTDGIDAVAASFDAPAARACASRVAAARTYTFVGDDVPADW